MENLNKIQGLSTLKDVGGLYVGVVTLTKPIARGWFERNTCNRTVRLETVGWLAGAMDRGEWQLNGEPIIFSKKGELLDGQHRVRAFLDSNLDELTVLVVFGADEKAFTTLDTGMKRTAGDFLRLRGEKETSVLASAISYIWRHENTSVGQKRPIPTYQQMERVLARHPKVRDSVALVRSYKPDMPPGMGAGLHYIFSQVDSSKADVFFKSLGTGADLSEGNPILTLRERLADNEKRHEKLPTIQIAAMTIKAWNAHFNNEPMKRLHTMKKGEVQEAFPKIAGLEKREQAAA